MSVLVRLGAVTVIAARCSGSGEPESRPEGMMRCDDGRRDYQVIKRQELPDQPAELVEFADLTSASLAADGKNLVVTVHMAIPLEDTTPNNRTRDAGVQLVFKGGDPFSGRNTYHVTFNWPQRTASFGRFKGAEQPVERAEVDATSAKAEISLRDLPKLGRDFRWRVQSTSYLTVSLDERPTVVTIFDLCPGAGDTSNPELLSFTSQPHSPETESTSTSTPATGSR